MSNKPDKLPDGVLDVGLWEHLKSDDLLGAVIRGHLFIEARLNQIIEYTLQHPEYLNLQRMEFAAKLSLAAATGWISKEMYGPLDRLNKLRNHMVHKRSFTITPQDEQDLINAIRQVKGVNNQPIANKDGPFFATPIFTDFDNFRKSIFWLYMIVTSSALVARDCSPHSKTHKAKE